MKKQQYVWILSLDGLASSDWKRITELPHFQDYLEKAAYCRTVYSVYPSVTYPAHTSIVTGKYPVHHGVINNTRLQPGRLGHEDWYWKRKAIHGRTLYDLAWEKGMSTAAFLWPVTGGAKSLTYNIPEVFANRRWDNQISASLRNGSKLLQAEVMLCYGNELNGIAQPNLDRFVHKAFLYTLRTRAPQVCFVHYSELDAMRHRFGHSSREADEALRHHDERLGDLLAFAREKGIMDQLTIAVLGDHSSLDVSYAVHLNSLFLQKGWIQTDAQGRIVGYQALSHTCDGSAYVYVTQPALVGPVRETLAAFSLENDCCIEKIYSADAARRFGANGACSLMLEARRGYYFLDELQKEIISKVDPANENMPHKMLSSHGYSPYKKEYTTVFSLRGPGIASGEVLSSMHLIDEGPLLAHVLGGTLPEADGRFHGEFFTDEAEKNA